MREMKRHQGSGTVAVFVDNTRSQLGKARGTERSLLVSPPVSSIHTSFVLTGKFRTISLFFLTINKSLSSLFVGAGHMKKESKITDNPVR